eukprot:TRINITY_DN2325_c0_g1_i4.p1 TRINITY_DN2325_c0_g1~~TRINITY_DN2325_c0_g1_i4.p1  ORF type:complete len:105 (-),score=19.83 TRINITY_DN2325_c0_g1_i4:137-451(-)
MCIRDRYGGAEERKMSIVASAIRTTMRKASRATQSRMASGSPVQGELFGEAPGPRKWASWELPYYTAMSGGALLLVLGLNAKPDTDIRTWARKEAQIRNAEEEE